MGKRTKPISFDALTRRQFRLAPSCGLPRGPLRPPPSYMFIGDNLLHRVLLISVSQTSVKKMDEHQSDWRFASRILPCSDLGQVVNLSLSVA